jgi:hypothetical protein
MMAKGLGRSEGHPGANPRMGVRSGVLKGVDTPSEGDSIKSLWNN